MSSARKLTPREHELVLLILKGLTQQQAARQLNVNKAWVSLAMARPRVAGLILEQQAENRRAANVAVQSGGIEAVLFFRACIANKDAPWTARVNSAREMAKMAGLYAPERVVVSNDPLESKSDAELLAIIDRSTPRQEVEEAEEAEEE